MRHSSNARARLTPGFIPGLASGLILFFVCFADAHAGGGACPNIGDVVDEQKISSTTGGLNDPLGTSDRFGAGVAVIGDRDGDGINDVVVGAPGDDDGQTDAGAIWILLLNANGTVKAKQKISNTSGGLTDHAGAPLANGDEFGTSVAVLGFPNGDHIDLIVGTPDDDDGAGGSGSVWILRVNTAGTVVSKQKISNTEGGFGGGLAALDSFGSAVTSLGDLDGDGLPDLAVGARRDDAGVADCGSVWIVGLNAAHTVTGKQIISLGLGGFGGTLDMFDDFGGALASADFNGDGTPDLVVGAAYDDDGGTDRGAIWILYLHPNGTVISERKISDTAGGFAGVLVNDDRFGSSIANAGDLDGDGVIDLIVGASGDDDGSIGAWNHGAVWTLLMNADGTVKDEHKISDLVGGFTGVLDDLDYFGASIAPLGDQDSDGSFDFAVGALLDDDGLQNAGALWMLDMTACLDAGCVADLVNDDDVVNVFDLLELLANWGTNGAGAELAAPTNVVNVFDLLDLLSAWGPCS